MAGQRAATLEGLASQPCDPLVLAVRDDGRPLHGLTGLIDWQLAARLSVLVRRGALRGGDPLLMPCSAQVPVRRLVLWKVDATSPDRVAALGRAIGGDRVGLCPADFGWTEKAIRRAFGATPVVVYG